MGYTPDRIKKRNMQIYEIYRKILIIEASVYAEERIKRRQSEYLKGVSEAVRILLCCTEQDRKHIQFDRKDGLYGFACKYRLPIFKNFSYKNWQKRLALLSHILKTPRSSQKHLYDEIPFQRLYPGLLRKQRHALIRKELERLRYWVPQFGPILQRQEPLGSNFAFWTDQKCM